MSDFREWKLCIVGEMGVGKTSILMRYNDKTFSNGLTTIGTGYATVRLRIDGVTHKMIVWDTAGQERFRSLAPLYYRGIKAALLVFSLDDKKSYRNIVEYWMPSIKGYASEEGCHIITCIVGNKCDLNIKRTVKREEAESFAAATGSIYFETSAKTGYNVDELFLALVQKVTSQLEERTRSSSLLHLTNTTDKPGTEQEEGSGQSCC